MQSTHIKAHIQNALDYIEANINTPVAIDTISDSVYLSKYHLQRLFKSITGKGIIEYARSRKLTESLYDLINSRATISAISRKYGFEYEQSFTRAFKTEFFLPPSEYRQNPKSVNITPKANISLLTELENAVIMKPFHVFRPSFTIGGVLNKVEIEENEVNYKATNVAVDFFYNKRQQITNAVNPNIYLGYTFWDKTCIDFTYYLSGVEVDGITELPDSFDYLVIPASNYSVFRFIGFFPPEQISWRHLNDIWNFKDDNLLKRKNVDIRNAYFQFEHIDMSICREDYCELDLYIPVV